MKQTATLHQLFEHDLKDMYFAEHQLLKALKTMSKETKDGKIKKAFEKHYDQTLGQVVRLKEVFHIIGRKPQSKRCPGILGLIEEKKEFSKERPTQDILDLYNLGAATKAERYEISAYEALIDSALKHDMTEVIPYLEENLKEEHEALDKVKMLVDEFDTSNIALA
jgi:ferritin-like metal-binding protein YciE